MSKTRFFITGGQGFLGTWICKRLLETVKPQKIMVLDLKQNDGIYKQVLTSEQVASIERCYGSVADTTFVKESVLAFEPTHIIHLAALQIPSCQANPVLGAQVNVLGTINVFEAAKAMKQAGKPAPRVVYASSAGVASRQADYSRDALLDDEHHHPEFHYGVYKIANEGNARAYNIHDGIDSVGLRPLTIFGVGREVGLTSAPTKAIKACLLQRKYTIEFTGFTGFNYVDDVAATFVACAVSTKKGAYALNIKCDVITVEKFVSLVTEVLPDASKYISIDKSKPELVIAYKYDYSGLSDLLDGADKIPFTSTKQAITKVINLFKALQADDKLLDNDL